MADPRELLVTLAKGVRREILTPGPGDPEANLTPIVRAFLEGMLGHHHAGEFALRQEHQVAGVGRPDFALVQGPLVVGHIELKAAGSGVDPARFTGHNKRQWERFGGLPNLLYTDGESWRLYQQGQEPSILKLDLDDPARDFAKLSGMVLRLGQWEPTVPRAPKEVAEYLAPLARMLRDEVTDAMKPKDSTLRELAAEWRKFLFPETSDAAFADAYAQTVTYALLLARNTGASTLTMASAVAGLAERQALLARALQIVTDDQVQRELGASLEVLRRVIDRVPQRFDQLDFERKEPGGRAGEAPIPTDPWLHFYEDFLAQYDPKMREQYGVYYTPLPVVNLQVRWADEALRTRLGRSRGFADPGVTTLDPAVGTGTYLLGILQHALRAEEARLGAGAVAGAASEMARSLHGFEILVGPYAVAALRTSEAITAAKGEIAPDGVPIYLADTLESPYSVTQSSFVGRALTQEHERARLMKLSRPVLVVIGNPPYDRHDAYKKGENESTTGGWVRHEARNDAKDTPIFEDFARPVRERGWGVHLKNAYNLYVYFWRWAIWKAFERDAGDPGIVSFITASSWIGGKAFYGMRETLAKECDEVWILDLGGDNRGARPEENVFDIETPVAICLALRKGARRAETPATVRYRRVSGTREEKLAALDATGSLDAGPWTPIAAGAETWLPSAGEVWEKMPLLTDLMPWQVTGAKFSRTWPIGPTEETVARRWQTLLSSSDQATAFKESRDRKVSGDYVDLLSRVKLPVIATLPVGTPPPPCGSLRAPQFPARLGNVRQPIRRCSELKPLVFAR